MRLALCSLLLGILSTTTAFSTPVESVLTPLNDTRADQVILQNDSYVDAGAPAYLQLGFITGEKAGMWAQVPANIAKLKVDYFRILMGGRDGEVTRQNIFFHAGSAPAGQYTPAIPKMVENAAAVTPGPYWNDIPVQGASGQTLCVAGGDLAGAAIEFTHDGAPSVYRDSDGMKNAAANVIYAIPGGWAYASSFGVTGDWILRIIGHEAKPGECP